MAAALALVPSWPRATAELSPAIPSFFTSPAANQIPEGSVVVSFPFTGATADEAMLWQETVHWRWKLVGGYASAPNTTGGVTSWPPPLQPLAVQEFLVYWTTATGGYLVKKPPPPDARLVSEMRVYVRRYRIGTVVVDSSWPDAETVISVLRTRSRRSCLGGRGGSLVERAEKSG